MGTGWAAGGRENRALVAALGLSMSLAAVGAGHAWTPAGPPQDVQVDRWPACWTEDVGGEPCVRDGIRRTAFESADGFVQRYAVAGPFQDKDFRKAKGLATWLDIIRSRNAFRALVTDTPLVSLFNSERLGRKDTPRRWVLAAEVFVPAAVQARLRFAVNGKATLHVNGRPVGEFSSDQLMLPDANTAVIALEEGWNTIHIGLEQLSNTRVAWMMRLRGLDGLPLRGVAWDLPERPHFAPAPDAGNALWCRALAPELEVAPATDVGWEVRGRLRLPGLIAQPLPRRLGLVWRQQLTPLAEDVPGIDALATKRWEVRALLPADATGPVSLTVDGEPCAVVEVGGLDKDLRRLRTAEATLAGLAESTLGPGGRASLEHTIGELEQLLTTNSLTSNGRSRLPALLRHLEEEIASARTDRNPFLTPGVHLRAYPSPIDGTLRRYVVVVPKNFDAALTRNGAVPLILLSHGLNYTPEDMLSIALAKPAGPRTAHDRGRLFTEPAPTLDHGAILVAHDGYDNAGQRAPGRADVLHVLDDVSAIYPIDPNRVTITGFSLGGSVSFWVSLLHADRFAGAAPHCGYPNLHDYTSVRSARKRPWEVALIAHEGVVDYVENGRQVPMRMVHGTKDNPKRSELIDDRYRALKYDSRLEKPALGHNVWDAAFEDGELLGWLASRRRNPRPPHVTLRTARYRTAQLDWVRIDRFAVWGVFGQVDAVAAPRKRLEIRTSNVDALTLRAALLPATIENHGDIAIDAQVLRKVDFTSDVHLARIDDTWQVVASPATGAKRRHVEGPLGDVFHEAFTVVVGTADPGQTEANRLTAERWRSPAPWISLRPPVIDDNAFVSEKFAGQHIVLIGGPKANHLTERWRAHLASHGIHFEDDAIRVGNRRFTGPDVGISVVVPSPHDPSRVLVVHAGVGAEGTLSSRYLPELSPDFLVYDGRIRLVYGDRILGPREVLHGGFFDRDWRLPE